MRTPPLSSSLEALESRIAPANVAAFMIEGTLVVQPSNPAEPSGARLAQTGPDSFDVLDGGHLFASFSDVLAVRMQGGAADDAFVLDPLDTAADRFRGPVTFAAGNSADDWIVIEEGELGGDLLLHGTQRVNIFTDPGTIVHGTLRIVSSGPGGGAILAGTFADVLMSGLRQATLSDFTAIGDVNIVARANAPFFLNSFNASEIKGDLTFTHAGQRGALVDFDDLAVGGRADFYSEGGKNEFIFQDTVFEGGLRLRADGGETIAGIIASNIGGPAIFRQSGNGIVVTAAGGTTFDSTVTMICDDTEFAPHFSVQGATVFGRVTLLGEGRGNGVEVTAGALLGGVTIRLGDGSHFLLAAPGTTVAGHVDFEAGDGGNALVIQEVGNLVSVRFISGSGPDTLWLNGAGGDFLKVNANLGGGADEVQITTANYVSINVHGGAGRDTLIDGDALTGPGVRLTSFERFTDS